MRIEPDEALKSYCVHFNLLEKIIAIQITESRLRDALTYCSLEGLINPEQILTRRPQILHK